jgi:hypothetical protein
MIIKYYNNLYKKHNHRLENISEYNNNLNYIWMDYNKKIKTYLNNYFYNNPNI